jgi:hypothetical protein
MDAYALAFGYVFQDGQEFLELIRVGALEGVRPCGDDKIRILEGLDGNIFLLAVAAGVLGKRDYEKTYDGVTGFARSG